MDDQVQKGHDWPGTSTDSLAGFPSVSLTSVQQGFYDPVNDKLIEPELAGISYSFTSDGYYEEAYYRAISNRRFPLHGELEHVIDHEY